jgi:type IV pilus assembly protein PilN
MIKINLLPVRAAKKKETAIQQIIVFIVAVVAVLLIVGGMYLYKQGQIDRTKTDINSANDKINELKNKIGKLEELKGLKEQVKKKLDVLAELRKKKTGPAQRLATLSDITPDQLWLTAYNEAGDAIKLNGMAYTEELIAKFMNNLSASNEYTGVELVISEQADIGGTKLKKFEITCKLKPSQPAPAAQPAAKK